MATACSSTSSPNDSAHPGGGKDIELPRDGRVVSARVASGSTFASLLRSARVAESEVVAIVARTAGVFDLRKVRAQQPYRLVQNEAGAVRDLEYEIDGDRILHVARTLEGGDGFTAEVVPIDKTRRVEFVHGHIDRQTPSLFGAMGAVGETVELPIALASIFGGEVDFNLDLQRGDSFELLVEKQYRACDDSAGPCEGRVFAGYGAIEAATFVNAGRTLKAVRFQPEGGDASYYDENGRSLRRFFLRSPLKFEPTISSGFSLARLHPVLEQVRAHLGVDYRAPAGAPVIAVADGVVLQAGWAGDAGRLVHLRHANGYETEYLHLSSISVNVGQRVRQGELVGRVGSSGLATGAHLDYRVKKNGSFMNPVLVHRSLPPAEPIDAAHMAAFTVARDRALGELGTRASAVGTATAVSAGK